MVRRKTRMVSLRLTEDQYQMLEQMVQRIRKRSGFKVTRASLMQRLMHMGLPVLEKEFPKSQTEASL